MAHFIIEFHISLVKAQTNYFNNNLLTLDVKLLIKIMKLYYLKALIDGQGKIKIYYGMSRVKKHPSGKRSIMVLGKLPPERLPPPPPNIISPYSQTNSPWKITTSKIATWKIDSGKMATPLKLPPSNFPLLPIS